MKKLIILTILFIASSCNVNCYKEVKRKEIKIEIKQRLSAWDIFIKALIQVESEGRPNAIGTKNDVGILQITPIYVKEVNRILGVDKYTLNCRTDINKSLEMFKIFQDYHNPKKDIKRAIKLHNPNASQSYRIKIMKQMKIIETNLS